MKNLSFWKAELRKTAEGRGRDPLLVEAMANRRIEIPDPKQEGKMLVQRGIIEFNDSGSRKFGFHRSDGQQL